MENALENPVQLARRLQVPAERLLDDDPVEPRALGHAGVLQLLGDRLVCRRRRRAVIDPVASDEPFVVEQVGPLLQRSEVFELAEVDLHVLDVVQESLQDLRFDRLGPRKLRYDFGRVLAEGVVGQVVDGGADHGEPGWQQPLLGQVVEGGEQLACAEVAGGAEDHHQRWVADPVVVQPFAERTGFYGAGRQRILTSFRPRRRARRTGCASSPASCRRRCPPSGCGSARTASG